MSNPSFKIVVAEALSESAMQRLQQAGEVVALPDCGRDRLIEAVRDCDALVVRTYAVVDSEVIAAGLRLRVIGRAGIGLDNIDLDAACNAGIAVVHTPAASTEAVAEMTIGLMVMLERRLSWAEQQLRRGEFVQARREPAGRELRDLTLGIIGFGRIGQRVAAIARGGFGMTIVYNDILEIPPGAVLARALTKEALYASADIISLHVPLTSQTRGLIGAPQLGQMKPATLLINTARGAVLDSGAVSAALCSGRIRGAAVDVFDPEPPNASDPLLRAPNCIVTPHIGSRTQTALAAMNDVVDQVIAVLRGQPA